VSSFRERDQQQSKRKTRGQSAGFGNADTERMSIRGRASDGDEVAHRYPMVLCIKSKVIWVEFKTKVVNISGNPGEEFLYVR
jgi:hypothetical protein